MNKRIKWLLVSGLTLSLWACSDKGKEKVSDTVVTGGKVTETSEKDLAPPAHLALLSAYPDQIKEIKDNYVVMTSGTKILFDDGKDKTHVERLDEGDVEDMFYVRYQVPDSAPAYLYDPGRSRSEKLYQEMYGKSASEVRKHLVPVKWFGQTVQFTSVNGAADSLKAVALEIADYPELKPYLTSSGTFYWRPVRGANRLSAHSYGIAFDIGVDKSDYWQWKGKTTDEMAKVAYANKIPRKLVDIFERHGFIWGGSWYHYDTMHFEFRPELLKYAELTK